MAKKVLIVYHSQGGNTEAAAQAVAEGVRSVEGVEPILKRAAEAKEDDLVQCDGICLGTPDYFSYMAGMLKDFFDRTFYPTQGKVDNKPCGIFVTHGGGGRASESVERICRSFRFKQVADTVLVRGRPDEEAKKRLRHLGASVAKAAL
ncbi:TPA: FprA family A-type flavoprotein [Candidatus Poribacteria bacterium]|nr:FprA family A-type flavoprotein [Candidatus Poribacteria bacterium]